MPVPPLLQILNLNLEEAPPALHLEGQPRFSESSVLVTSGTVFGCQNSRRAGISEENPKRPSHIRMV